MVQCVTVISTSAGDIYPVSLNKKRSEPVKYCSKPYEPSQDVEKKKVVQLLLVKDCRVGKQTKPSRKYPAWRVSLQGFEIYENGEVHSSQSEKGVIDVDPSRKVKIITKGKTEISLSFAGNSKETYPIVVEPGAISFWCLKGNVNQNKIVTKGIPVAAPKDATTLTTASTRPKVLLRTSTTRVDIHSIDVPAATITRLTTTSSTLKPPTTTPATTTMVLNPAVNYNYLLLPVSVVLIVLFSLVLVGAFVFFLVSKSRRRGGAVGGKSNETTPPGGAVANKSFDSKFNINGACGYRGETSRITQAQSVSAVYEPARKRYDVPIVRGQYDVNTITNRYDAPRTWSPYVSPTVRDHYDSPVVRNHYDRPAVRDHSKKHTLGDHHEHSAVRDHSKNSTVGDHYDVTEENIYAEIQTGIVSDRNHQSRLNGVSDENITYVEMTGFNSASRDCVNTENGAIYEEIRC